jgi:hypothetical protein
VISQQKKRRFLAKLARFTYQNRTPSIKCSMKALRIVATLVLITPCAWSETLVVPEDRADQRGTSYGTSPFNGSGRSQLVYGSRNFPGPILITGMSFRNTAFYSTSSQIERLTIRLSTYSGTMASFNLAAMDLNRGPDDRVAFDGSMLFRSSGVTGAGVPPPFQLVVQYSDPFAYDPARGDLLIDYTTFNARGDILADYHHTGDARIGWVAESGMFASGGPGSFVTQFSFSQIPEPGVSALSIAGLAMIMRRHRRNSVC